MMIMPKEAIQHIAVEAAKIIAQAMKEERKPFITYDEWWEDVITNIERQ